MKSLIILKIVSFVLIYKFTDFNVNHIPKNNNKQMKLMLN